MLFGVFRPKDIGHLEPFVFSRWVSCSLLEELTFLSAAMTAPTVAMLNVLGTSYIFSLVFYC